MLGLIFLVSFVLADDSYILIKNKSSDADINGVVSWGPTQSKSENSVAMTGKLHPGQNATIQVPSSKRKLSLSLNSLVQSDTVVPIVSQTLVGPTKRCYAVTGAKGKLTWNQEPCN